MARAAKGEGTLYKTPYGTWRGYVTLDNGKRKYFSGATKAEAAANRKKLLQQRDTTGIATGKGYNVEQWLTHWIDTKAQADHAPKTTQSYRLMLSRYISDDMKARPLNKVSIESVEAEYQRLQDDGLAGSTIHQVHALMSAGFNSAVRRGHMPFNPVSLVENKPKAHAKKPESLSFADLQAIENALDGYRLKARWMLALTLGLRPAEIRGLEWSHIDFDKGELHVRQQVQVIDKQWIIREVTKTSAGRRTLPLPGFLAEMLQQHRLEQLQEFDPAFMWSPDGEPHAWVFTSERTAGKPLSPNGEARSWATILNRAGIPQVRPYATRHTAASMLIAHGTDPVTVAEILGHKDANFTIRTYVHSIDERKREAAETLNAAFSERSVNR